MSAVRRCTCYLLPHADDCEIFVGITQSGERVLERRSGEDRRAPSGSPSAELGISKIIDHAEVIGNVTEALLDLDASYAGNRVTFTFLSTNDAMSHIQRARRIVEERLSLIRAARDAIGSPSATLATRDAVIEECALLCEGFQIHYSQLGFSENERTAWTLAGQIREMKSGGERDTTKPADRNLPNG